MNLKKQVCFILFIVLFISSCVSVKPYQKMYLNDEDMELKPGDCIQFEVAFESYREGTSGANGGKVGGGCGCN